jgi:hypothetical protein
MLPDFFFVLSLVAIWFLCLKLAAAITRPFLAYRQMYALLLVILAVPAVFVAIGTLISFVGTAFCHCSPNGIVQRLAWATKWLWALPVATDIAWKYLKTYNGWTS